MCWKWMPEIFAYKLMFCLQKYFEVAKTEKNILQQNRKISFFYHWTISIFLVLWLRSLLYLIHLQCSLLGCYARISELFVALTRLNWLFGAVTRIIDYLVPWPGSLFIWHPEHWLFENLTRALKQYCWCGFHCLLFCSNIYIYFVMINCIDFSCNAIFL